MNRTENRISPDTIARTLILALALVNQILAIAGHSAIAFTDNDMYQLVSLCWTVVASLTAWWKNNSFTCVACQADAWKKAQAEQQSKNSDK